MSQYFRILTLLAFLSLTSCNDVIDLEVPIAPSLLVIEASLDWELETAGNEQIIYLSLSTPYFDSEQINVVTGATVKVVNDTNGKVFIFEDQNNGAYKTINFEPIVNQSYTLQVVYNNEVYIANETLMPGVKIDEVVQSIDQGFDKDALEVNVFFTDPANIENFYILKFQQEGDYLPSLFDFSDEFTDGNQLTIFNENEDYEIGNTVHIELLNISKQYYNYIRLLIEQSSNGGPFSTIPAQLKGNCINTTNSNNTAFGYFRLTQVSKESYTFEATP